MKEAALAFGLVAIRGKSYLLMNGMLVGVITYMKTKLRRCSFVRDDRDMCRKPVDSLTMFLQPHLSGIC